MRYLVLDMCAEDLRGLREYVGGHRGVVVEANDACSAAEAGYSRLFQPDDGPVSVLVVPLGALGMTVMVQVRSRIVAEYGDELDEVFNG